MKEAVCLFFVQIFVLRTLKNKPKRKDILLDFGETFWTSRCAIPQPNLCSLEISGNRHMRLHAATIFQIGALEYHGEQFERPLLWFCCTGDSGHVWMPPFMQGLFFRMRL